MNRIKKGMISGIALVLAGSMALPAAAAQNAAYSRIATYELVPQSPRTVDTWEYEEPIRMEDLKKADPDVKVLEEDGAIYQISGTKLPLKAGDASEALKTAYQLTEMLGCPEDIKLVRGPELQMDENHIIYVFRQIFEDAEVPGSTIRLVTGPEGRVTTVFNSLFDILPESTGIRLADQMEAVNAVRSYLQENHPKAVVLPEYTAQTLLPQEVELTDNTDDILPDLLYWIVYSDNPGDSQFPYLAHYVSAEGDWMYCNEVKSPGDEASWSGYTAAYAFDSMEAAEWSGSVTGVDGDTEQITVPVMRDTNTGVYYLGDVQRRIAVGEYYDLAFDDKELKLLSSEDNTGWPEDDLLTYFNYIQVWDYYARMGWHGPDGNGTPSLLLRGLVMNDGVPMDNAAYFGPFHGWQLFCYDNSTYHFGEAMDVIAHEFTHCVTGTAQAGNLYWNDQGAINESLSDIMGNLCETELEQDPDTEWLLGENSTAALRSMLNPNDYQQPEYVWDIYYASPTLAPNDINDRGGVHYNSSILNRLAARLYLEDGMSLEEMKSFWMTVIFGMTPMTDLPQIADTLRWALTESGNEKYETVLEKDIQEAQLTRTEIPDQIEEGRQLVSLQLPDTPVMSDEFWFMEAVQLGDIGLLDLVSLVPTVLQFFDEDATEPDVEPEEMDFLNHGLLNTYNTWVSDESRTMYLMMEDKPTLYLMMNIDPENFEPRGMLVLIGNRWFDLMGMIADVGIESSSVDETMEALVNNLLESGMELGQDFLSSLLDKNDTSSTQAGGKVTVLPSAGLETAGLHDDMDLELNMDMDSYME